MKKVMIFLFVMITVIAFADDDLKIIGKVTNINKNTKQFSVVTVNGVKYTFETNRKTDFEWANVKHDKNGKKLSDDTNFDALKINMSVEVEYKNTKNQLIANEVEIYK